MTKEDDTLQQYYQSYRTLVKEHRAFIEQYQNQMPTLRDQFAMSALSGITANAFKVGGPEYFANQAYAIADAMLEAREAK